jgi:hypothetical protein
VKKEACYVIEKLGWKNVVKPQATNDFKKGAKKRGPIFLNFKNFVFRFLRMINIFWHGASVVIGRNAFSEILHSRLNGIMSAS